MDDLKQIALTFLTTLIIISVLSLFARDDRHSRIIKPIFGAYLALCLISSAMGSGGKIEFDLGNLESFGLEQAESSLNETYQMILEEEIGRLLIKLGIDGAEVAAEVNIENKTSIYCHKVVIHLSKDYQAQEQDISRAVYEFCLAYPEIEFTG